jgi:sulfoxide reductase catalytic subunit YedY
MSDKFKPDIPESRVTPPEVFFGRREFLGTLGLGILAACRTANGVEESGKLTPPFHRPGIFPAERNPDIELPSGMGRTELTPRDVAASFNNFYEFIPGGGGPVWKFVDKFEVDPWKVEVSGECQKPMKLDLDDIFAFQQEERIYHFRCVERWAMNVPWTGFPLRTLLEKVEPKDSAQYVRFVSAYERSQMPGAKDSPWYPWPYHEGLRMDEAMNDLTFVATGEVGREDRARQEAAEDILANPTPRVRLPLQHQSQHPPPALESRAVSLARHARSLPDPDLQWLREICGRTLPRRASHSAKAFAGRSDRTLRDCWLTRGFVSVILELVDRASHQGTESWTGW